MAKQVSSIRLILWLILAFFVGWLLWLGVAPTGEISYVYDFKKPNFFIQKITPAERVLEPENGSQAVLGGPIYFALRTQRTFDTARVTIRFKNPDNFPLLEAGVLADKSTWRYQMRPLDNQLLDRLEAKWQVVRAGDLALYSRTGKYRSIEDFLARPATTSELAVYNYDFKTDFIIPDYRAASSSEFTLPLRGNYQFYAYIKDEPLEFSFLLQDLNENKDADPISIKLFDGEQLMKAANLPDDGIATDNNQPTAARRLDLSVVDLPEGAYKIEVAANDDIVTESFRTGQHKIAFINRLWLADSKVRNIKLFTDSRGINVQTSNPASLQKILVAGQAIDLSETYRQFGMTLGGKSNEMIIAKPDIIVSGDGVFSFGPDALIDPGPVRLVPGADLDRQGINYVLARYTPPRLEDGWQVATAEFDLKIAYREFYKYNVMLSIPGLKAEDKSGKQVALGEIRVDLFGTDLWTKFKRLWQKN